MTSQISVLTPAPGATPFGAYPFNEAMYVAQPVAPVYCNDRPTVATTGFWPGPSLPQPVTQAFIQRPGTQTNQVEEIIQYVNNHLTEKSTSRARSPSPPVRRVEPKSEPLKIETSRIKVKSRKQPTLSRSREVRHRGVIKNENVKSELCSIL